MKIALIVCYFGDMPWYFDYFLYSCKFNPTVTFYLITDNTFLEKSIPDNVIIVNKTLENINTIASQKLGFETHIDEPYKLCDFKPAYGFLFPDLVRNYDFWGHADLDIIFGNIPTFMTDELLHDYDVISIRHDWLTGCFTLYRNSQKTNTLFKCSKDYKKVLGSGKHYCFDEANFAHTQFTAGIPFNQIKSEIESMTHVVKRLDEEGYIKAYFDIHVIEGLTGKMRWINGRLFYRNTFEIILYHLIRLKKIYNPRIVQKIPSEFRISPTRIYT